MADPGAPSQGLGALLGELAGSERVLTLLVGLVGVALAVYRGWQGIEGLGLG